MGPTVISGLPAHILLVHIVLAIVPIAAVLVIVAGIWPGARRWLNWLPPLAALGALVAVPITTHAGHWLEDHLRGQITPAIQHHVDLGNQMLPWVIALFAASVIVWALARAEGLRSLAVGQSRGGRPGAPAGAVRSGSTTYGGANTGRFHGCSVKIVVAIIALVAAVGAVQQVYRTGEAGSRAVWSGTFTN